MASRSRTRRRSSPASTSTSARSRAAPTSSTPRSCAASRCGSPRRSGGRSSPRAPASCPTPSQRWAPFKETNPQLTQVLQEVPDGAHLEHRRQAAGPDAPPPAARLRPRRHRPAGALLQARSGALQGVRAAHRHQEGLGPHRGQLLPRRRAVPEGEGPGHLGQPQPGGARRRPEEARRPRSRRSWRRPSSSAPPSATRACASSRCTPTSSSPRHGCGRRTAPRSAPARRGSWSTRRSSPTSSRCCPPSSSRPASRSAACWPPTATGTTCSAAWPSRAPRSGWARRPRPT